MPLAWIDPPNTVRDVAPADPTLIYHPDVAAFYTVEVPEGTVNGATLQDGEWVNPLPPAPAQPQPPAPPPVPLSITPLQARRALLAANLLDDVETLMESAPREARLAWEYAIEVRRDDVTLETMATALNLTSEQIDDLFRAGALL